MKYPYFNLPPIDTVYIDKAVTRLNFVTEILDNLQQYTEYKSTRLIEIDDYRELLSGHLERDIRNDQFTEGKKKLLIYPELGNFMHSCPGSDGVVCCRYFVLDFGMNCPYDCHYCYLQTYAKFPYLTIAGNIDELLGKLKLKIDSTPEIFWRIGTGEYMDSLALEKITGMGKKLVEFFSQFKNATLELKTKSIEIDSLLELEHLESSIISWSLNPDYIIENVEINASSLDERFKAARKVINAGYQVGFHFDPIIYYENWEKDYIALIDRIFEEIPTRSIRWISLGTFRYTPGLKEKLRVRYPDEFITRSEMLLHTDNKFRYPAFIRRKIYKTIYDYILGKDSRMMVYLCMETQNTWKKIIPGEIIKPLILDKYFEKRRLLTKLPF